MEHSIEYKVRELVTDFQLEDALDLLIAQAQTQTQRKQNVLLVLKGKLALLEEQSLAGMLTNEEVARQKATIAHQILDIADGSPLDFEVPAPREATPPPIVQKTGTAAAAGSGAKYFLVLGLVAAAVLVGFLILKLSNGNQTEPAEEPSPVHPKTEQTQELPESQTTPKSGGPLKVLNFPNLQKPFNFLDSSIDFRWADAEWISDSEIRLKVRYYLTCKSNLGVCYRPSLRLYADGKPIAPVDQSNTTAWVEKDATITDDLNFVLPSDTKTFEIEWSRDHSTWRRPFNILQ